MCLELYEGSGPAAVEELLERNPDSSDLVRERLDLLGRMGLVGEAPRESRPEHVGEYRILGELGRGGMGVVYEAERSSPKRRVALKVLPSAFTDDPDRLARFEREAKVLGSLPGATSRHC